MITTRQLEQARAALDAFSIELPSWGFANTGTRFGKFNKPPPPPPPRKSWPMPAVHRFTGCCPTVAMHVLWDFPDGKFSVPEVMLMAERYGVKIGAINPNVFQDQIYKHGSLGNPDPADPPHRPAAHSGLHRDRQRHRQPRYFAVVRGWLELSGHGQYPASPPAGSRKA